jgi:hypothetical protein
LSLLQVYRNGAHHHDQQQDQKQERVGADLDIIHGILPDFEAVEIVAHSLRNAENGLAIPRQLHYAK